MSISAGSLRIGNYVMHSEKGVIQITAYGIHLFEKERLCKVKSISAIKLSDEILECFGFVWETKSKRHLQLTLPEQG